MFAGDTPASAGGRGTGFLLSTGISSNIQKPELIKPAPLYSLFVVCEYNGL